MPRPRSIAALLALTLLVAACSGSGGGGSAQTATSIPGPPASADALCPSAPDVTSAPEGWESPATPPVTLPLLVTNAVTCGQARLLLLFLDSQNRVVSAPDRTASIAFYDLGRDASKSVATADGTFIWTIPDDRGMYIFDVALPEAGTWGAEVTTEAPGAPKETTRMTFDVHDTSTTVQVGQKAPASKTLTLADVGGDVTKVSTDTDPNKDFYTTSVGDAIAAKEPFILIFATPKFCKSAQCGPTLDQLKPVAAANPGVTFINVEPYELKVVDGQLQPVLTTTDPPDLTPTAATVEWGLTSEPWIFAVDSNGIVQKSYELIASPAEMDAAIKAIAPLG
jgi:hypothetical protein